MIRNLLITIPVATALLLGTSCSRKANPVSLPVDTTQVFTEAGVANLPDKWWTSFEDEKLNSLVDTALSSNFTLQTAWYRLSAAQAVVTREASAFFPSLEGTANADYRDPALEGATNENFQLGLSSSYEIDLWGRIRSRVDAQRYRADATLSDYQTAAITLSVQIVNTWYQLMEAENQLALVNEQIETNQKVLSLIKARFGSGQIRSVDILRQRQLIESTREQKIAIESRIETLEHQLAVLLGHTPQQVVVYTSDSLPGLPPMPDAGIPAELINRRPDVQSAFNQLQAADRDMASAISNRYPRLTLSASLFSDGSNAEDLFDNWVRTVAGNLLVPIFYGRELNAEVKRTEAIKMQRLYEYGQSVLTAFHEVEDALIREKKQQERIESIERQLQMARQTYEQLELEYINGMSDYLDVLTALGEEQQLRRDLIAAKLSLLQYRIDLYRALAGGFETKDMTE